MIQLVGRLLVECADPDRDFVGHVGGDDFALLFQSADWQDKLQNMLQEFDRSVRSFFDPAHLAAGGFEMTGRNGEHMRFPLTSLSVGVVRVKPGQYPTHYEVGSATAEAKKQAKKQAGSSLFVERRHLPPAQGYHQSMGV
uniref:GGDEF domain-containing protein n=1 Tax=Anopheles coluzzii TaxID=1518534 RepID=A0A8W7Q0W2_ANOCL